MEEDPFGGDDGSDPTTDDEEWDVPAPPATTREESAERGRALLVRGLSGDQEADAGNRGEEKTDAGSGAGTTTTTTTTSSSEPRKEDPHAMNLRTAQQWRGGQVPGWAMQVAAADLRQARDAVAADQAQAWSSDGDPRDRERGGGRILYEAVCGGKIGWAKALIAGGANVQWNNPVRSHKQTALFAAVNSLDKRSAGDIVGGLVEAGADIDHVDRYQRSYLYMAAAQGQDACGILDELIKAGATIDLADRDGWTPLYVAALRGHIAVVDRLITAGAKVNLTNKNGQTPLFAAVAKGHGDTAQRLLIAGADVNHADEEGSTPLFAAAENTYRPEMVALLLRAGADANVVDSFGSTPLYTAAEAGNVEWAVQLIEAGAQVDTTRQEFDGATPLWAAAMAGHGEVARRLIQAGAKVDLGDAEFGQSPLFVAAGQGHQEIVGDLLQAGADVNLADKRKGATALMACCSGGHKEIAATLIAAGADLAAVTGREWQGHAAGSTARNVAERTSKYKSEVHDWGDDFWRSGTKGRQQQKEQQERRRRRQQQDAGAAGSKAAGSNIDAGNTDSAQRKGDTAIGDRIRKTNI